MPASSKSNSLVKSTSPHDILSGRKGGFFSSTYQHRAGNQLYQALLKENKGLYQQATTLEGKRMLLSSIIQALQQHGGRFLRKHGRQWMTLTEDAVFRQTCQAMDAAIMASSPPPPPVSHFRRALRDMKQRHNKDNNLSLRSITVDENDTSDKENQQALVRVKEEYPMTPATPLFEEGLPALIHDDDDSDDSFLWEDLDLVPLDVDDHDILDTHEFSFLCGNLLASWGETC